MEFKKIYINEPIYKTEIDSDIEYKLRVAKGGSERRDNLGAWDQQIHTTKHKQERSTVWITVNCGKF